jgi:hypothetical protein
MDELLDRENTGMHNCFIVIYKGRGKTEQYHQ